MASVQHKCEHFSALGVLTSVVWFVGSEFTKAVVTCRFAHRPGLHSGDVKYYSGANTIIKKFTS